jgi:hypothetical protein
MNQGTWHVECQGSKQAAILSQPCRFRPAARGGRATPCAYFLMNTRSHTPWPSFRPRFSNLVSGR